MKKTIVTLALGLAVFGVKADSYQVSASIPDTTLTDWTNTVSVAQFNPALGTLTGISVKLSSDLITTLSFTNLAGANSDAVGDLQTILRVYFQDAGAHFGTYSGGTGALKYGGNTDQSYDLAPGEGITASGLTDLASTTYTPSLGLVASEFEGTGDVVFDLYSKTSTLVGNSGGNFVASQTTQAGAGVLVTYTFTAPAPEPSTMALIGSGLVGTGLVLRRRNK